MEGGVKLGSNEQIEKRRARAPYSGTAIVGQGRNWLMSRPTASGLADHSALLNELAQIKASANRANLAEDVEQVQGDFRTDAANLGLARSRDEASLQRSWLELSRGSFLDKIGKTAATLINTASAVTMVSDKLGGGDVNEEAVKGGGKTDAIGPTQSGESLDSTTSGELTTKRNWLGEFSDFMKGLGFSGNLYESRKLVASYRAAMAREDAKATDAIAKVGKVYGEIAEITMPKDGGPVDYETRFKEMNEALSRAMLVFAELAGGQ